MPITSVDRTGMVRAGDAPTRASRGGLRLFSTRREPRGRTASCREMRISTRVQRGTLPALAIVAIVAALGASCGDGRAQRERSLTLTNYDARAVALVQKGLDADGDLGKQEDLFRKAIEIDYEYARAHGNLGIVYFQQGRYGEAAGELAQAIRLKPTEPEHPYNLGLVYERLRKLEQAIECYKDALALAPDDIRFMKALARCYVKAQVEEDELVGLLRKIERQETSEAWIRWAQAELIKIESRRRYRLSDE